MFRVHDSVFIRKGTKDENVFGHIVYVFVLRRRYSMCCFRFLYYFFALFLILSTPLHREEESKLVLPLGYDNTSFSHPLVLCNLYRISLLYLVLRNIRLLFKITNIRVKHRFPAIFLTTDFKGVSRKILAGVLLTRNDYHF